MNRCFNNQLPAVVFDGVKTSRMLSCQAVTIGHDVRGGVTGVGKGVRHGWWLVSDRPRRTTPPHATPLATPHVSIVNVELYSVNCGLLSCFWNFFY